MRKVVKKDFVSDIYNKVSGVNKSIVKNIIDCFIDELNKYLLMDEDIIIELRRFGVIEKKRINKDFVINPLTREKIKIKKIYKIKYNPSKMIKKGLIKYL